MSKSVYKKMEREQERLAKQFKSTKENPLKMLGLGWVFEAWYEKLILVALVILGLWKLGGLIF